MKILLFGDVGGSRIKRRSLNGMLTMIMKRFIAKFANEWDLCKAIAVNPSPGKSGFAATSPSQMNYSART